jgi:ribonucleoside-diphosphate reductase alpha chain
MEEPLPAGGSCLLGSINLAKFVDNAFTDNCCIDFESLEKAVAMSIQALNQVLLEGMDLHPLEIQRKSVYNWRQIGLGTMGLGDMLIKLGVTYGSEKSIKIIDSVFKFIATTAVETSLQLAKIEGCYPMCNKEALAESSFIKALELPLNTIEDIRKFGLFNSQLLTCAPTGSIGTMLQVSTGVEVNFAFSFNRRTISLNSKETVYKVDADIVRQFKEVAKIEGDTILPEYFVTAAQINPIDRIKVQAALQKWIDASISSTINLPESTTIEEVENIYFEAWKHGLKGVTIWRDNCNRQAILSTEKKEEKLESIPVQLEHSALKRGEIIKAGEECIGLKRTLTTGCGSLHCEAFFHPTTGELREIYLSKGSTGGCHNFMVGLSRMISLSARGGVKIDNILDQLKSCGVCPSYAVRSATKKDTSKGSCCPVAVGNALKDMYNEIQGILCKCNNVQTPKVIETDNSLEECPNCHEKTLIHEGGCVSCPSCSWTKCS